MTSSADLGKAYSLHHAAESEFLKGRYINFLNEQTIDSSDLCKLILCLLQLILLLAQLSLSRVELLAFWFNHPVDPAVHLHRPNPHAEGASSKGDAADDLRLEVRLDDVLADLL